MAVIYVDSNAGAGAGTGLTWADAYESFALAEAGELPYAAGDFIYVASDHAESTSSTVIFNFAGGTNEEPVLLISVDKTSGEPPTTYSVGASITITGGTNDLDFGTGSFVCYGITFVSPDNIRSSATGDRFDRTFVDCTFDAADLPFVVDNNATRTTFDNCTFISLDASGNFNFDVLCQVLMKNCTFDLQSLTTSLFTFNADDGTTVTIEDCDLSSVNSGVSLVTFSANSDNSHVVFRRCLLPNNYNISSPNFGNNSSLTIESCSDSTSTVPFLGMTHYSNSFGSVEATTAAVRTGGASDGVQTYAWEVVAASTINYYTPFELPPIVYWAEEGVAQTVTIHTAHNADINTDEMWMTVEYPDSATPAGPQHLIITTRPNPLVTGNAITRDSGSTWSSAETGSDGSTGQQKLSAGPFTPKESGPVIIRVYVAKYDGTPHSVYIDPKPVVTGLDGNIRTVQGVTWTEAGGGAGVASILGGGNLTGGFA